MVKEQILKVFDDLKIDRSLLEDKTLLSEELGMDSQEFIELLCALEKSFDIKLPDDFAARARSFESVQFLVEQHLVSKQGNIACPIH